PFDACEGVRACLDFPGPCDDPTVPPPTTRPCLDFRGREPDAGPNPRVEEGFTFRSFNFDGSLATQTQIVDFGTGLVGLDCNFLTEILLPAPTGAVKIGRASCRETVKKYVGDGAETIIYQRK